MKQGLGLRRWHLRHHAGEPDEMLQPNHEHGADLPWIGLLTAFALLAHLILLIRAYGACRRLVSQFVAGNSDPMGEPAPAELKSASYSQPEGKHTAKNRGGSAPTADAGEIVDPEALERLPLIIDLVREHVGRLDELRNSPELGRLLDASVHDDLFLLRYLLSSKGKVSQAKEKIRRVSIRPLRSPSSAPHHRGTEPPPPTLLPPPHPRVSNGEERTPQCSHQKRLSVRGCPPLYSPSPYKRHHYPYVTPPAARAGGVGANGACHPDRHPTHSIGVRIAAAGWTPTATLPWRTRAGQPVAVAAPFLADLDAKPEDFHFKSGIANREVGFIVRVGLQTRGGGLHSGSGTANREAGWSCVTRYCTVRWL